MAGTRLLWCGAPGTAGAAWRRRFAAVAGKTLSQGERSQLADQCRTSMRAIPSRLLRRAARRRGLCTGAKALLAEHQHGCPQGVPWQEEFERLAAEAALAAPLAAAATPHGTRGLVATRPLPPASLLLSGEPPALQLVRNWYPALKQPVSCAVDVANTLCVGFGATRSSAAAGRLYLRRWQQRHGCLPPALLGFLREGERLQDESRWRAAACRFAPGAAH